MHRLKLPNILRPNSNRYRQVNPGIDFPTWFIDDIKGIDENLYFVYHPYKVMYENVMNQYTGPQGDDERFAIHEELGYQIWGFLLKQFNSEAPIPDRRWHLWRLCDPYGWAHVTIVEDKDPAYLKLLAKRLYQQAVISDKFDSKVWARMNEEERQKYEAARQKAADNLFEDVQKENEWLLRKAADNMSSGLTAPTNPTKDIITSYSGQTNHSKIVRPLHDTEGGLVLPDWAKEIG